MAKDAMQNQISNEQELILEAVRVYLGTKDRISEELFSAVDYENLAKEMFRQGIYTLVYHTLSAYAEKIQEADWKLLEKVFFLGASKSMKRIMNQGELFHLLEEHEEQYCVLKGVASGEYYPRPEDRLFGDGDFLILKDRQKKIEKVLLENGYQQPGLDNQIHQVFRKNEFQYEMHIEIPGIPEGTPGEKVKAFMADLFDHTHTWMLSDYAFCVPDPEYHLMIILLHMVHHMLGEGIGLRHLMDYACFIERTKGDDFWQEKTLPLLKEIGLLTYAKGMADACQTAFHISIPEFLKGTDETLGEKILSDVLTGGDFGRKNRIRARSGVLIGQHGKRGTKHGKLANLFYSLHDTTVTVYPIVKKVKVLHPILDGYRGIKHLGKCLTKKDAGWIQASQYATERKTIYDRLHVFEIQEK